MYVDSTVIRSETSYFREDYVTDLESCPSYPELMTIVANCELAIRVTRKDHLRAWLSFLQHPIIYQPFAPPVHHHRVASRGDENGQKKRVAKHKLYDGGFSAGNYAALPVMLSDK